MPDAVSARTAQSPRSRRPARRLTLLGTAALVTLAASRAPAQVPWPFDNSPTATEGGFLPPIAPTSSVPVPVHRPDVLDLEPAVTQAELILAVRLADVAETKIVHGGRKVEVTQQYRFEPVKVLKGIFARGELLMTGQDLGIYRFAEGTDRLERGQLLLVLLGRQNGGYFNCSVAPTLGQSIPRLDGQEDPLLNAVETLIAMTRRRDRAERVALLRDALKGAKGREATPLLLALGRRALLAARDPAVPDAVLPFLTSDTPSIREVAARTLAALLEALPAQSRAEAARVLATSLDEGRPDLAARIAMIDALGLAGGAAIRRTPEAMAWLQAEKKPRTHAEAAARLRVLGRIDATAASGEVADTYEALLLDALDPIQEVVGRTLVRLDPEKAAGLIASRLTRKDEAGLDIAPEITLLGELPPAIATPALLKAWERPLDPHERLAFARACVRITDRRLVPAVSTLLDPRQSETRTHAMETLRRIDTDEAASALWPHLDEETDVSRKLRLIAFLGRHGFRDGQAQALEQLSQAAVREEAVAAVTAFADPKVIPELHRIWRDSNDLAWKAAAIRALARLDQQDIAPKLLEIARTPGERLADSALIALGDLGSAEALPVVREALNSRRDDTVIAAARAATTLLARPDLRDDAIRDRLAALLADPDASPAVRQSALRALKALADPRLAPTLDAVARDANLEGTPLLDEVESALIERSPDE